MRHVLFVELLFTLETKIVGYRGNKTLSVPQQKSAKSQLDERKLSKPLHVYFVSFLGAVIVFWPVQS